MGRHPLIVSIITIGVFLLLLQLPPFHPVEITRYIPRPLLETIWKLLWVGMCLLTVKLLHGLNTREACRELGFRTPLTLALGAGALASLSFLILAPVSQLNPNFTVVALLQTTLASGLGEEVLFRGFVFGQLYRRARWPFWAAAMMNALPFAWGHLYQSKETGLSLLAGIAEVMLVMTIFASLAAWIFVRWEFNLWVLIAFHALANAWAYLFFEGQEAMYGWLFYVLVLSMILLLIFLTWRWNPRIVRPEIPQ